MPEESPPTESAEIPSNTEEALKRLTSTNEAIIDGSLSYIKELFAREEKRRNIVEGKANTLLGFSSLASALVVGLGTLLLRFYTEFQQYPLVVFTILYLAILVTLVRTILHAHKALQLREYSDAHPVDVYDFQSDKTIEMKKKWIASLMVAYGRNIRATNEMATKLLSAQRWFGYGIMLLLVFAGLLVICLHWPIPANIGDCILPLFIL